jgi:hypothetical protein
VNLALEASIHVGLAILLATACLLILLPFIPLLTWGIIIAVATYPGFRKLQKVLGGRETLAAVVCTLILLAVLIVPAILLGEALVGGIQAVTAHLKDGSAIIPPPPPTIESWPVIGVPLKSVWGLASRDLTEAVRMFAPKIKTVLPGLLSASAGIGRRCNVAVDSSRRSSPGERRGCRRRLRYQSPWREGPEFQQPGATIRSVTFGILGCIIQSAAAPVPGGGMPAVGLWTVIFVFAAIVQVSSSC